MDVAHPCRELNAHKRYKSSEASRRLASRSDWSARELEGDDHYLLLRSI